MHCQNAANKKQSNNLILAEYGATVESGYVNFAWGTVWYCIAITNIVIRHVTSIEHLALVIHCYRTLPARADWRRQTMQLLEGFWMAVCLYTLLQVTNYSIYTSFTPLLCQFDSRTVIYISTSTCSMRVTVNGKAGLLTNSSLTQIKCDYFRFYCLGFRLVGEWQEQIQNTNLHHSMKNDLPRRKNCVIWCPLKQNNIEFPEAMLWPYQCQDLFMPYITNETCFPSSFKLLFFSNNSRVKSLK